MSGKRVTEEQRRLITEVYADHTMKETARIVGVSTDTVYRQVARLGLRHSEAFEKEIWNRRYQHNVGTAWPEEKKTSVSEKLRKIIARERRRILFGEQQKTRRRLVMLPKRVARYLRHACETYGYFRSDDPNRTVLYYDSQTRRSAKTEAWAAKKHGIRFEQGAE